MRTRVHCARVGGENDNWDALVVEPSLPLSHLEADEELAEACMRGLSMGM